MKAYNVTYGPNVGRDAFVVDIPCRECNFKVGSILRDSEGKEFTVKGIFVDGSPNSAASVLLQGKPDRNKTVLYA